MKKLFLTALILALIVAGSALAETFDTFNITITVAHVEISLWASDGSVGYTTWAIGALDYSQVATMSATTGGTNILISNESTVDTSFEAWISTQASGWTNSSSPGNNIYVLKIAGQGDVIAAPTSFTTLVLTGESNAVIFDPSLGIGQDRYAFCEFTAPTSTTSAQRTITVTIKAIP